MWAEKFLRLFCWSFYQLFYNSFPSVFITGINDWGCKRVISIKYNRKCKFQTEEKPNIPARFAHQKSRKTKKEINF